MASVAREYKWSPDVLGDLFFDAEDYLGLLFWHEDIKEMQKNLPKLPTGK